LEKVWGAGAIVSESPIIFIPNALITVAAEAIQTVGALAGLGDIALQVIPVVSVTAGDEETALQSLIVEEKLAETASPATPVVGTMTGNFNAVPGIYHTVVTGDWLSKIAQRYYGNMKKWPVIYAANHKMIGPNPDMIKPNQKLFVPDLPQARLISASMLPERSSMAFA
jgi:nucleoid-associated protein YgaU